MTGREKLEKTLHDMSDDELAAKMAPILECNDCPVGIERCSEHEREDCFEELLWWLTHDTCSN